jgi:hypothetical protein
VTQFGPGKTNPGLPRPVQQDLGLMISAFLTTSFLTAIGQVEDRNPTNSLLVPHGAILDRALERFIPIGLQKSIQDFQRIDSDAFDHGSLVKFL